mmetsp:Transcript_7908/g.9038  ORF Transcript_7908/g.9038 Transcript_7908/m.9038 type:complete len:609 (-) Transcript_7908:333-2159(-)
MAEKRAFPSTKPVSESGLHELNSLGTPRRKRNKTQGDLSTFRIDVTLEPAYFLRIANNVAISKTRIPDDGVRSKPKENLDVKNWKKFKLILKKVIVNTAYNLYPGDSEKLIQEVCSEIRQGSVSQQHDKTNAEGNEAKLAAKEVSKSVHEGKKVKYYLTKLMLQFPRGTMLKRLCRAVLCKSMSYVRLRRFIQSEFTDRKTLLGKGSHQMGLKDWRELETGKTLQLDVAKRSYQQFDLAKVEAAVEIILSSKCVEHKVWESKEVKMGQNDRVLLPLLHKVLEPKDIWRVYQAQISSENQVSKSSFYKILRLLTAEENYGLSSSESPLHTQLYEPMRNLLRMVVGHVRAEALEGYLQYLDTMVLFLREVYPSHLVQDDECATHSINHALGLAEEKKIMELSCVSCNFPFYVLGLLTKEFGDRPDLLSFIESVRTKIRRFMGQQIRSKHSRRSTSSKQSTNSSDMSLQEDENRSKHLSSHAARYAAKYCELNQSQFQFYQTARNKLTNMTGKTQVAESYTAEEIKDDFGSGWGKRPTRGVQYQSESIADFVDDIREIFEHDILNKIVRTSAPEIYDKLRYKHPDRFDHPPHAIIRRELIQLFNNEKVPIS